MFKFINVCIADPIKNIKSRQIFNLIFRSIQRRLFVIQKGHSQRRLEVCFVLNEKSTEF